MVLIIGCLCQYFFLVYLSLLWRELSRGGVFAAQPQEAKICIRGVLVNINSSYLFSYGGKDEKMYCFVIFLLFSFLD